MNRNLIVNSMVIKPEHAVRFRRLGLEQECSLFYWGELNREGTTGWGLFMCLNPQETPVYMGGDDFAEEIYASGEEVRDYVLDFYAAYDLAQMTQILQLNTLAANQSMESDDAVSLPMVSRDHKYHELAAAYGEYLLGMMEKELANDEYCNGALDIYQRQA